MKKATIFAAVLGMAIILGGPVKSEAFCLIGCGGDKGADVDRKDAEINVSGSSDVDDSSLIAGDGNTTATNLRNSVVIGGSTSATQRNIVGGIRNNRGDISQSNAANITGNLETNIHDNDMRSFRNSAGNMN